MARPLKVLIVNAATAAAILLAAGMAIYALFLLLVGVPGTVVREGEVTRSVRYFPHPAAVVPLLATAILLGGLLTRKLLIAWIGFAILSTFSVLFLFSIGGGLLPMTGLLLVLLTIITISRRNAS